jgi:tRNA A37 methylthiotransferase MiaB
MPTLKTVTLGCKVNQYETEYVRQGLQRLGYRDAENGRPADLCVVNTCTVTADGDAKSRKAIRHLHKLYPNAEIIVMGCYATREPEKIAAMPGVVDVITDKRQLPELLERFGLPDAHSGISTFGERHRAYVKVQDGCNARCSYCIIPLVRPVPQSRPAADVLAEVHRLTDNGHREIVLTGIHLGHYGADFHEACEQLLHQPRFDGLSATAGLPSSAGNMVGANKGDSPIFALDATRLCPKIGTVPNAYVEQGGQSHFRDDATHRYPIIGTAPGPKIGTVPDGPIDLARLLRLVTDLPGEFRVRVSSIEAAEVTPELLAVMAERPERVCPHLHISMQSGSDAVLRRMNRRWPVEQFLRRCEEARVALDNPALTTDVIVGFPGETESDFAATCRAVESAGFSKLHVFRFCPRPGTPAADMPDRVPAETQQRRAAELAEIGRQLRRRYLKSLEGRRLQVLVESVCPKKPGVVAGTSGQYTRVELPGGSELIGRLVNQ